MDDLDGETIGIVAVLDLAVSALITFIFVMVAQPPDDSKTPIYVTIVTFVVLVVAEFLCWLFHIPEPKE